MDLTLIEVMPLGEIGEGRLDQYLPLSLVHHLEYRGSARGCGSSIEVYCCRREA